MPIRTSKGEAASMDPPDETSKASTGDTNGDRTQGQDSFEKLLVSQAVKG